MKSLLVLLFSLLSVSSFAKTPSKLSDLTLNDINILAQTYEEFIRNEFVTDDYCQNGYGDVEEYKIKILSSCARAKEAMLKEFRGDFMSWTRDFFEFSKVKTLNNTQITFIRVLDMGPNPILDCQVSFDLVLDKNNKMIKHDFNFYCDH